MSPAFRISLKVETCERAPTPDFTKHADRVFSALFPPLDGHFRRLREFASRAGYEDWFQRWVDVEREATALCSWEQSIVYGLLQTREYARAILRAARRMTRTTRSSSRPRHGWSVRRSSPGRTRRSSGYAVAQEQLQRRERRQLRRSRNAGGWQSRCS